MQIIRRKSTFMLFIILLLVLLLRLLAPYALKQGVNYPIYTTPGLNDHVGII